MVKTVLNIEVAYAMPDKQLVMPLQIPAGTTLYDAVIQSGIAAYIPELDLTQASLGVFGKLEKSPHTRILIEGERVEIYRPLLNDPKAVRRARAAKAKERLTTQDNTHPSGLPSARE